MHQFIHVSSVHQHGSLVKSQPEEQSCSVFQRYSSKYSRYRWGFFFRICLDLPAPHLSGSIQISQQITQIDCLETFLDRSRRNYWATLEFVCLPPLSRLATVGRSLTFCGSVFSFKGRSWGLLPVLPNIPHFPVRLPLVFSYVLHQFHWFV